MTESGIGSVRNRLAVEVQRWNKNSQTREFSLLLKSGVGIRTVKQRKTNGQTFLLLHNGTRFHEGSFTTCSALFSYRAVLCAVTKLVELAPSSEFRRQSQAKERITSFPLVLDWIWESFRCTTLTHTLFGCVVARLLFRLCTWLVW